MLTKNIVKLPKSQIDIQVTMQWADMQAKWDEVFNKAAAEIEIPGFRKGQAPVNIVEPRILPQVQQEALKQIMPAALIEALQGSTYVPIDYPQYNVTAFQKGGELKFTARVTVKPEVKVGNYKVVNAQRPPLKTASDEEVEKIITDLFQRYQARQPVQPSNTQVPQPGSQGAAGGSMSFNQAPPSASPQPGNVPTAPNDDFAKAMGANTLAELKTKIKTDLEAEAKYNNELDYEESILQEVEKITNVDIPEVLIQDELARMLLSLQRNVSDRGLLMEEYLKGQKKTVEQLKAEWRPQAERNVRMELGLSEIARNENVNITDEELQAEVDKIQDNKVKQQFTQQEPRMHLRHALRQTKTLNLLKTIVK
jgi:trigger factor